MLAVASNKEGYPYIAVPEAWGGILQAGGKKPPNEIYPGQLFFVEKIKNRLILQIFENLELFPNAFAYI